MEILLILIFQAHNKQIKFWGFVCLLFGFSPQKKSPQLKFLCGETELTEDMLQNTMACFLGPNIKNPTAR